MSLAKLTAARWSLAGALIGLSAELVGLRMALLMVAAALITPSKREWLTPSTASELISP